MMDSVVNQIKRKFALPSRLKNSEYNVWTDFGDLAAKMKAVDLGQGFPNCPIPSRITSVLSDVANSENNLFHQYTRSAGHRRLVNVIGELYSKLLNRKLDPLREILITCGAYEALYCAIAAHIEEGDEVILIEPFFDSYQPMIQVSGGIVRYIPLRKTRSEKTDIYSSNDWKFDENELKSIFNNKTKIIILNTPQNPTGKVFTREELDLIAELCIKYNVLCISDEVYEWMIYQPAKHIRIATLPGMWERTITIGSAGKSFCVTGWKCGWAYGPSNLIKNLSVVHEINVNSYITPIQESVARCFENEFPKINSPDCWFNITAKQLQAKRDYFVKLLLEAGLKPIVPDGSCFIVADCTDLANKIDLSAEENPYKDIKIAHWLAKNIKLVGIPPSVFYSEENKYFAENQIRFCFFKTEETLDAAAKCLQNIKSSLSNFREDEN